MHQKEYCILNKQYTEEEWNDLVPRIIQHMDENGEWGEFFPTELSPFAYNETVAQEFFPLKKKEVESKGWHWKEHEDDLEYDKVIDALKLPTSIDAVPDDILNWAIRCESSGRLFKITAQELDFYRRMQIAIPHLHPNERHQNRISLKNPRHLWDRTCDKCQKAIRTSYAPDRPETVYCEACYLAEVY